MSGTETNCCSMATSGSLADRPASRFRELMVFLRFEISCVLAASPR